MELNSSESLNAVYKSSAAIKIEKIIIVVASEIIHCVKIERLRKETKKR